ncbi:MAG: hypothetical protein ACYCYM_12250 [Saccharofermentanales bacterium]
MKIVKKVLIQQNRCYAAGNIVFNGKAMALLATEGEGACYAFSGKDYEKKRDVWTEPGGTMTFVPLPGTNGEFLSVQKFFRLFQWEEATIVWVRPQEDGTFIVKELFTLPYIHRFDILVAGGKQYFIGCTLATKKETREDWSCPGKVYVAQMPADLDQPIRLTVLMDSLTQNHGYSSVIWEGKAAAMIGAMEGAFIITPPQVQNADWSIEQIMDWPVGDLAAIDIDGDGELEIAAIEPFHGRYFRVYKKTGGSYRLIYEHPETSEFYHVVKDTTLLGKPVFIGGCRRGKQQLFYITPKQGTSLQLESVLIEEGVGPSNIAVIHEETRDVIISANREKGEAALYFVTD